MSKTHWADVDIFDCDGNKVTDHEKQAELMREYRDSGCIHQYFLTDNNDEDAWDTGQKPDEIDFSDIDFIEAECEAATAKYADSDDFGVENVRLTIKPGWELIGDTGYSPDIGWNDINWSNISDSLSDLDDEACVEDAVITARLPVGYEALFVNHEDDDYNNSQSSATNA